MARVLVAGGTGYLGGFVLGEFRRRGHFVRALARNAERLAGAADEVVEGEVTRAHTLDGVCRDIDVVFSSVGITRQRDGLTFMDVDFQGNSKLLDAARTAGVGKFVYVSVLGAENLRHLDIVKAHEDFVDVLAASGLDYAVIRPTGFFSDMEEFLTMARRGRVFLIGSGENRVNPIHGADLAVCCVDAAEGERREIAVGGPETMSYREIAGLACETVGKPVRITSVPSWLVRAVVKSVRVFDRHRGELLAFLSTMATIDVVAPEAIGSRTLKAHFTDLTA